MFCFCKFHYRRSRNSETENIRAVPLSWRQARNETPWVDGGVGSQREFYSPARPLTRPQNVANPRAAYTQSQGQAKVAYG